MMVNRSIVASEDTLAFHANGVLSQSRSAVISCDCPPSRHWKCHGDCQLMVTMLPSSAAARWARNVLREVLLEADVDDGDTCDAESAVAELAANAHAHGRGPCELRIIIARGVPVWCEVVDSDPDLGRIPAILDELGTAGSRLESDPSMLAESGRGLLLAHQLSNGRCHAYATTLRTTAAPGKAVAFALPKTRTASAIADTNPQPGPPLGTSIRMAKIR